MIGKTNMTNHKQKILSKICYTELVYGRINKKLHQNFSITEIEKLLYQIITETDEINFERIGKNIYITNQKSNIRITINSFTNRVITVDRLK